MATAECPPSDGSAPKQQRFDGEPPMCIDPAHRYGAEIVTSKGTMVVALDTLAAPLTVNNFVVLARYHYYDGIIFHRIITSHCPILWWICLWVRLVNPKVAGRRNCKRRSCTVRNQTPVGQVKPFHLQTLTSRISTKPIY